MDILPDRPDKSNPASTREYICEDSEFQSLYPAIYEYLARVKFNGQDRTPSRLVIYYEEEQLTVMLTDPHTGKILFHTSEAVDVALGSLNARLMEQPVRGWKADKRALMRR